MARCVDVHIALCARTWQYLSTCISNTAGSRLSMHGKCPHANAKPSTGNLTLSSVSSPHSPVVGVHSSDFVRRSPLFVHCGRLNLQDVQCSNVPRSMSFLLFYIMHRNTHTLRIISGGARVRPEPTVPTVHPG